MTDKQEHDNTGSSGHMSRETESIRRRGRNPEQDAPAGLSALNDIGTAASPPGTLRDEAMDLSVSDDGDDIEALRRDIARLEGKLDAVLAALDIEE